MRWRWMRRLRRCTLYAVAVDETLRRCTLYEAAVDETLRRCTLYEAAVDETAVAMDETAGMKRAL
jgi:hypothetical protein